MDEWVNEWTGLWLAKELTLWKIMLNEQNPTFIQGPRDIQEPHTDILCDF